MRIAWGLLLLAVLALPAAAEPPGLVFERITDACVAAGVASVDGACEVRHVGILEVAPCRIDSWGEEVCWMRLNYTLEGDGLPASSKFLDAYVTYRAGDFTVFSYMCEEWWIGAERIKCQDDHVWALVTPRGTCRDFTVVGIFSDLWPALEARVEEPLRFCQAANGTPSVERR